MFFSLSLPLSVCVWPTIDTTNLGVFTLPSFHVTPTLGVEQIGLQKWQLSNSVWNPHFYPSPTLPPPPLWLSILLFTWKFLCTLCTVHCLPFSNSIRTGEHTFHSLSWSEWRICSFSLPFSGTKVYLSVLVVFTMQIDCCLSLQLKEKKIWKKEEEKNTKLPNNLWTLVFCHCGISVSFFPLLVRVSIRTQFSLHFFFSSNVDSSFLHY